MPGKRKKEKRAGICRGRSGKERLLEERQSRVPFNRFQGYEKKNP